MSKKTIAKFSAFVILIAFVCAVFSKCSLVSSHDKRKPKIDKSESNYYEPQIVGKIESDEITESSGLAASRCQPDVFWTHNDSGDDAFIFAFNSRGKHLGTWRVQNARNMDWEDMAGFKDSSGKCFLYIGEIGNTDDNTWTEHKIYRVAEPQVLAAASNSKRGDPLQTEAAEVLTFRYPDTRQDAETLIMHPQTGDIYVLTKHRDKPSGIYKLRPDFNSGRTVGAEKIGDLTVPAIPNGFLTGGSAAPDGKRVIICDYFAAYELILPEGAKNFDEIWKEKPVAIDLGERKQGEAISYSSDGNSVFATSEKKHSPINEVKKRIP